MVTIARHTVTLNAANCAAVISHQTIIPCFLTCLAKPTERSCPSSLHRELAEVSLGNFVVLMLAQLLGDPLHFSLKPVDFRVSLALRAAHVKHRPEKY